MHNVELAGTPQSLHKSARAYDETGTLANKYKQEERVASRHKRTRLNVLDRPFLSCYTVIMSQSKLIFFGNATMTDHAIVNDYYGGGGGGYLTGGSPFGGSTSGSPGGAERVRQIFLLTSMVVINYIREGPCSSLCVQ